MTENHGSTGGLYAWIDSLRTVRSPDRWIGGVVAGISGRLGLDRTLGRALFVVVTLLTSGFTVLLYGLAWMFLPEPDGRIHAREAGRGRWTSGTTGALIVTVLGIGQLVSLPGQVYRGEGLWGFGGLVGLALIGLFVWLVATRGERSQQAPQPTAPRPAPVHPAPVHPAPVHPAPTHLMPSDTGWYATADTPGPEGSDTMSATTSDMSTPASAPRRPETPADPPVDRTPPSLTGPSQLAVVGLAVLAGAAVSLLRYLDVLTAPWPAIWAASLATALAVMAIGLVIGAIAGRGGGGLTVTTAILALPVIGATGGAAFVDGVDGPWQVFSVRGDWNGGSLTGNPSDGYELSFGDATLDLTGVTPENTARPVTMDLSFSSVDLLVPDDVDVYLEVDNSFSSVHTPDLGTDGAGRIQVVDAPGDERLVVDADLSFSTLTVRAESPSGTDAVTTPGSIPSPDTTQE